MFNNFSKQTNWRGKLPVKFEYQLQIGSNGVRWSSKLSYFSLILVIYEKFSLL